MKTFNFTVTGALIMTVEAKSQKQAEELAESYLEENSPIRNWEIDSWNDIDFDGEDVDIAI